MTKVMIAVATLLWIGWMLMMTVVGCAPHHKQPRLLPTHFHNCKKVGDSYNCTCEEYTLAIDAKTQKQYLECWK